jgi:hypothetical protein
LACWCRPAEHRQSATTKPLCTANFAIASVISPSVISQLGVPLDDQSGFMTHRDRLPVYGRAGYYQAHVAPQPNFPLIKQGRSR